MVYIVNNQAISSPKQPSDLCWLTDVIFSRFHHDRLLMWMDRKDLGCQSIDVKMTSGQGAAELIQSILPT